MDMLESYDECMKDRADQTVLPQNMLDHVRVQRPIGPCAFFGDEVLAYEESVDFIGNMVEIDNKVTMANDDIHIAKDLN
eukprot:7385090-Pyramimonas_sp.AAC.1